MSAVLIAGAVLAGCGDDAAADRQRTDPTGDVFDKDLAQQGPVDRDLPNVDLVAADLRHTGKSVRVRLTYDRLVPRPAHGWEVFLYLETSRGREYQVSFTRAQYADTKRWHQDSGIMRFDSESALPSPCDGLSDKRSLPEPRVDRPAATLTIDVPVRCVGRPTWVEVHGLETTLSVGRRSTLVDNPFNDDAESKEVVRLTAPRG